MADNECSCPQKELRYAEHFYVTGKVHIFLVLDLAYFVVDKYKKDFERLRGGNAFARSLQTLSPSLPFIPDDEENATAKRGREFSIFRGYLLNKWLFPTFLLDKTRAASPEHTVVKKNWDNFEYRIRLSRTGFLEIKLTHSIFSPSQPGHEERLIDLLSALLEIGSRRNGEGVVPIQWGLAWHCANLFIQALSASVKFKEIDPAVTIAWKPDEKFDMEKMEKIQRHRYIILFLDNIICKCCGKRVKGKTFLERDKKILGAVLEGALIQREQDRYEFPDLDKEAVRGFIDRATWENELCIFAPERCLIYYPPEQIYLPGQSLVAGPVKQKDYWKCLVRGIEHTITVRAALQLLQAHTTRELDEVPHLNKKITDGEITTEDEIAIRSMGDAISNTFNMLPGLREILVPTSAFRASYAVNKFSHLSEVFYLQDMHQHIQRNVDELVIFLNHFKNVELQEELQRGEFAINVVGILVAVVAFFAVGPSFVQDFHSFFSDFFELSKEDSIAIFLLVGVFLVALIGLWIVYVIRRRRNRKLKIRRRLGAIR